MKNLISNAKNPFVIVTLFFVFTLYFKIIPSQSKNEFYSVIPKGSINYVEGVISSNPIKSSASEKYFCTVKVKYVSSEKISSTAKGELTMFFPSSIIEAYYPGKLFSLAKNKGAILCEQNATIGVFGKIGNGNIFFVERVQKQEFQKTFFSRIFYFRALCRLHFKRLMYAWKDAGGLLLALLSGAKEYLPNDLSLSFRKAGLSHILALSGMHLSLVTSFAFLATKKWSKKVSDIFHLFSIIFFVWFAGFSPSLFRAFFCALTIFLLKMISIKNVNMIYVLCFCFLIHIMIFPPHIFNLAFMFSYGALLGILLFSEFFSNALIKKVPPFFAFSLGTSLAAQVITIPISIYFFKSFMPIGIIATIFVSPLITLFIYIGLVLILICLIFPPLNIFAGLIMNFLYNIIELLVSFFALAPGVNL